MPRSNLKLIRKARQLTQREMSAEIGISEAHYKAIELGIDDPSYKVMKALEAYLERTAFPKLNGTHGHSYDIWEVFRNESSKKIPVTVASSVDDIKVQTDWGAK